MSEVDRAGRAERMIASYGDQAYHKAVEFTVIAENVGDPEGAQIYAAAARELLQRGYHKNPRDAKIPPEILRV
jgi:hypothetical protein